jgi:hypothetical protein
MAAVTVGDVRAGDVVTIGLPYNLVGHVVVAVGPDPGGSPGIRLDFEHEGKDGHTAWIVLDPAFPVDVL